jgi:hypothetical protein
MATPPKAKMMMKMPKGKLAEMGKMMSAEERMAGKMTNRPQPPAKPPGRLKASGGGKKARRSGY